MGPSRPLEALASESPIDMAVTSSPDGKLHANRVNEGGIRLPACPARLHSSGHSFPDPRDLGSDGRPLLASAGNRRRLFRRTAARDRVVLEQSWLCQLRPERRPPGELLGHCLEFERVFLFERPFA